MSIFAGIQNVPESQGASKYLGEGLWTLKIKKCELFESSKKKNQFYFLGEFEVIDSNVEDARVGETRSWLVNMDLGDTALANIREFAMAITPGAKKEDITPELIEEIISAENPTAGLLVKAEGSQRICHEYTVFRWDPVS